MTKDYRVEIKVKNNPLYQAIMSAGYRTVSQFAARAGLAPAEIYNYMNLKRVPVKRDGSWRRPVLRMAHALRVAPENLFPPQHVWDVLVDNTGVLEMSREEIGQLPMSAVKMLTDETTPESGMMRKDLMAALMDSVGALTYREQMVVRLRHGLDDGHEKTWDEIAAVTYQLGSDHNTITRERGRQIYEKALRKLRGHSPPKNPGDIRTGFPQRAVRLRNLRLTG